MAGKLNVSVFSTRLLPEKAREALAFEGLVFGLVFTVKPVCIGDHNCWKITGRRSISDTEAFSFPLTASYDWSSLQCFDEDEPLFKRFIHHLISERWGSKS